MEILLVHELGKHLAVYKQVLSKNNEQKLKAQPQSISIVRHLNLLACKGKFDIHLMLVPGPLDLLENMSALSRPLLGFDICDDLLDKKRFECDPLADDAVLAAVKDRGENVLRNHELYSTVKELGETMRDLSCARFMEFYEQVPPWNVEWERCELGRRLFVRNSGIAGLVLLYGSLITSFTASLGNKVFTSQFRVLTT